MLRTRVISALVLFAVVAGPAIAGGPLFFLLIAIISTLATWEYATLFRQGGYNPMLPLGIALSLLFIVQSQWPDAIPLGLLLTLAVLSSLIWTLGQRSIAPATDWALTLAGSLYLGWLLGHFIRLRALDNGLLWLFLAAAGVWAADVTAYFAGRAFGRHKWWPRHSPNKTWEGYLSGVLASVAVVGALGTWLLQTPVVSSLMLGLAIGSIAPLGDLAESMIKRQVGAKDSSGLIPGHGGVLDRIDTLLFSIPIVYYWVSLTLR